ncbi:Transcriptional regulator, AraC family [Labilithrix luteola]|uniref:Transcriptional regulator, AraC family n=1 Tax=Labilithrix luteola TaxID=1391654 RepID=A0A0K1PV99_9BACT|nr:helix-turn-helix domain-containing protein [Labilithrix luteola]AKU97457.1 Transcriptional regulator, AraC family [Labilithrix luteola]
MRIVADARMRADVLRPWPPLLATAGPGSASAMHAHHAMHLIVARSGTLRVRQGKARAKARSAAGILTSPDVPHAIDASGVEVVLVFVDPESDVGERLLATFDDPLRLVTEGERDALLSDLPRGATPDAIMIWAEGAMARFAGAPQTKRRMHPRVKTLLARLRTMPLDADTTLPALAASAGLSESRLLHVFRESVGIPIRPYLLWLKVQRAVTSFAAGKSLTQAAHDAGFADAAHMSRTFRRMFGMPASELKKGVVSAAR